MKFPNNYLVHQGYLHPFVLIDFFAEWCGYCHQLSPRLVPGAEASGEDVLVLKVKVQDRQDYTNLGFLTNMMQGTGFPEIQAWKDGYLIDYSSGAISESEVTSFIKESMDYWRNNRHLFTEGTEAKLKNRLLESHIA